MPSLRRLPSVPNCVHSLQRSRLARAALLLATLVAACADSELTATLTFDRSFEPNLPIDLRPRFVDPNTLVLVEGTAALVRIDVYRDGEPVEDALVFLALAPSPHEDPIARVTAGPDARRILVEALEPGEVAWSLRSNRGVIRRQGRLEILAQNP